MRAVGAGEVALCCHLPARVRSASALRRRQVACVRVTQMCDIIICFPFKSMCQFGHFQYDKKKKKKKRFVLAQREPSVAIAKNAFASGGPNQRGQGG